VRLFSSINVNQGETTLSEEKMNFILDLIVTSATRVWLTFLHNWPFLLISAVLAAALKLYLDPQRVSTFLTRYQKAGVVGATAIAVTTPLCSCGTTAVVLGMIANLMPWAPIVAFMAASPLTSPEELVYSAGLFGWRFALAFFVASIFVGLVGGAVASLMDRRGWLANQTRLSLKTNTNQGVTQVAQTSGSRSAGTVTDAVQPVRLSMQPASAPCCASEGQQLLSLDAIACGFDRVGSTCVAPIALISCGFEASQPSEIPPAQACSCSEKKMLTSKAVSPAMFLKETLDTGKRLLVLFFSFAFIGYFLNGLIPAAWVTGIFGSGNAFSVSLAATLGLPLYVNTEASLPLVRTMLDAGMSQGAALAFLITGSGTSFGAVAGMLTIARWRVVTLVIGTLWVTAILFGTVYNLLF
jgi:uncharacterized membrane protein YraQ (UPF0718 family)